jgi:hypothetical protein
VSEMVDFYAVVQGRINDCKCKFDFKASSRGVVMLLVS